MKLFTIIASTSLLSMMLGTVVAQAAPAYRSDDDRYGYPKFGATDVRMNLTRRQLREWQRIEDYSVPFNSLNHYQRMQLLSVVNHQIDRRRPDLVTVYDSRNNLGRYSPRERRRMRADEARFFATLTSNEKHEILAEIKRRLRYR